MNHIIMIETAALSSAIALRVFRQQAKPIKFRKHKTKEGNYLVECSEEESKKIQDKIDEMVSRALLSLE
jgi:hypothetical protein